MILRKAGLQATFFLESPRLLLDSPGISQSSPRSSGRTLFPYGTAPQLARAVPTRPLLPAVPKGRHP